MKVYIFICFFVLFHSCSKQKIKENNDIVVYDTVWVNNQNVSQIPKETSSINLDSIKQEILVSKEKLKLSVSDTVKYQFSLEDVGTEGNEGAAYYLNDSVRKAEIDIYTSQWKICLLYLFDKTYIKVTEQIYNIANEQLGNGIELIKDFSYTIDLNGVPLAKVDSDRVDVFQEFKEAVPFILK